MSRHKQTIYAIILTICALLIALYVIPKGISNWEESSVQGCQITTGTDDCK